MPGQTIAEFSVACYLAHLLREEMMTHANIVYIKLTDCVLTRLCPRRCILVNAIIVQRFVSRCRFWGLLAKTKNRDGQPTSAYFLNPCRLIPTRAAWPEKVTGRNFFLLSRWCFAYALKSAILKHVGLISTEANWVNLRYRLRPSSTSLASSFPFPTSLFRT